MLEFLVGLRDQQTKTIDLFEVLCYHNTVLRLVPLISCCKPMFCQAYWNYILKILPKNYRYFIINCDIREWEHIKQIKSLKNRNSRFLGLSIVLLLKYPTTWNVVKSPTRDQVCIWEKRLRRIHRIRIFFLQ